MPPKQLSGYGDEAARAYHHLAQLPAPDATNVTSAKTALDASLAYLCSKLTGNLDKPDPNQEAIDRAIKLCKEGNPFPLTGTLIPSLIVDQNAPDYEIFLKDAQDQSLYEAVTPEMREAIFDPRNPVLRIDYWQRIILAALFDVTVFEVFIKGCTGAGKGASASLALLLWYYVNPQDARITITSRDASHAERNLFGDVVKWYRQMIVPPAGRQLGTSITDHERHYIKILNPDPRSQTAGESFSGAHGSMYVFDEASASPEIFYENCIKNARKVMALSNPRTLFGFFRNGFKGLPDEDKTGIVYGSIGQRLCITIGGMDCMNVRYGRLKQPVAPKGGITIGPYSYKEGDRIRGPAAKEVRELIHNQIDLALYYANKSKPDPNDVAVFADGKFPREDPNKQVILPSWLERHIKAWTPDYAEPVAFGFDIARSLEGDETVLACGSDKGICRIESWQFADTVYHTNQCLLIADRLGVDLRRGRNPVCVDMDGLGAGVGDMLRNMGVWVIEYRGNASAETDRRQYANLRAEAYALLAKRFSPMERWKDEPWAIPNDETMIRGLIAVEKVYGADPLRFHITPKSSRPGQNIITVKSKLEGKSPDRADSVVYLFHAVRTYYNLNDYFSSFTTPLVMYPSEEHPAEKQPAFDVIQKPKQSPPAQQQSLAEYIESTYGKQKSNKYNLF